MNWEVKEKHLRRWIYALCILLQGIPFTYLAYVIVAFKKYHFTVILILGIAFLVLSDLILFKRILKESEKGFLEEKYRMSKYQNKIQLKYLDDLKQHEAESDVLKKELVDQLQIVKRQIQSGGIDDTIKDFVTLIDQSKTAVYSDHPVINCIVADKKREAERKDIHFESEINLPSGLNIESVDLCSVLGNLLDNAIEACEKIDAPEERRIQVKSMVKSGFLIIKVENTYDAGALHLTDSHYETTKKDKVHHGLGIHIVQKTVEKYSGRLVVEPTESLFTVIAYLQAKGE